MSADPHKLEAIKYIKTPVNADEVRSLLRKAGDVSRSIPDFTTIIGPLRKLPKSKKVTWVCEKNRKNR